MATAACVESEHLARPLTTIEGSGNVEEVATVAGEAGQAQHRSTAGEAGRGPMADVKADPVAHLHLEAPRAP